jgi:hypothetical protein
MNFITHFKGWIARVEADDRLKIHHVSIYVALFQCWNANRLRNPFTIFRHEIMAISKVGSLTTYTNGLKDLSEWNYIRYEPSFHSQVGSKVHLYRFDKGGDKGTDKARDKGGGKGSEKGASKAGGKGDSKGTGKAAGKGGDTYYTNNPNSKNSINNLNRVNGYGTRNETSNFVNGGEADTHPPAAGPDHHHRRKKNRDTGGRGRAAAAIPATLEEAQAYFLEIQSTAHEAEKFYDHYQSNGWQVGGKSPMKDWRAAARQWKRNVNKFAYEPAKQPKPGKLNTGPKNYAEPL